MCLDTISSQLSRTKQGIQQIQRHARGPAVGSRVSGPSFCKPSFWTRSLLSSQLFAEGGIRTERGASCKPPTDLLGFVVSSLLYWEDVFSPFIESKRTQSKSNLRCYAFSVQQRARIGDVSLPASILLSTRSSSSESSELELTIDRVSCSESSSASAASSRSLSRISATSR